MPVEVRPFGICRNVSSHRALAWLLILIAATACGGQDTSQPAVSPDLERPPTLAAALTPEPAIDSFALAIDAFPAGGSVPARYTCEGEDVSPGLSWGEPPPGTQGFAVIMDDPDAPAGIWDHWVLFNLPSGLRGLPEAQPKEARLDNGATQGSNSWPSGNIGYRGPCPPPGPPHRYRFFLYAVDRVLDLSPGSAKGELLEALEGHIVGESVYTGMYRR